MGRLVDMALNPRIKVKLDLSIFGNRLEISDKVPTFATPKDAVKKQEGSADHGENGTTTETGNIPKKNDRFENPFDHLFRDEEGTMVKDNDADEQTATEIDTAA